PPVDEHDHIGAQVALVIEHIAAQPRVDRESIFERATQGGRATVHLGRGGETAQLRCEGDVRHAGMMHRPIGATQAQCPCAGTCMGSASTIAAPTPENAARCGRAAMNPGLVYAALAYTVWGLFPLYFRQVAAVPAFEIVVH